MFNIADVIILAVIALAGWLGYTKGFIKTGFGFLSFFIAVTITFVFYKPVMNLIRENTGFEGWLSEYLYSIDLKKDSEKEEKKDNNNVEDTEEGEKYIQNLPDTVVEFIGLEEMKENAKAKIIEKIVDFALKLLSIIVVYIVARLALWILVLVLDLIAKLPVLKQFNETLGLAIGIILGLIRVYAVFMVITLISSLPLAHGIVELINNSLIASILYNNNFLLKILF